MSILNLNKKLLSVIAVTGVFSVGCGTGWLPGDQPSQDVLSDARMSQTPRPDEVQSEVNSETIRQVQQRLNELNYEAGPVDGQMGPQTRGALRDFQAARGLAQTGRLNASTLNALDIEAGAAAEHGMQTARSEEQTRSEARQPHEQAGVQRAGQQQFQTALSPEEIRQVQQKLNESGFDAGQVDGIMGPRTEAAIKNFQESNAIEATGSLNQKTLDELGVEVDRQKEQANQLGQQDEGFFNGGIFDDQKGEQQTAQTRAERQASEQGYLHQAMRSEQIREVQKKLNEIGYHSGNVDGKWGPETQAAVRNFQKAKGIEATGQLDQRTLDELGVEVERDQETGREEQKDGGGEEKNNL